MTNIANEFYFLRFIPKDFFSLDINLYKMYTCIYSIKNNYNLISITFKQLIISRKLFFF